MQTKNAARTGMLALVLVALFLISWESFWRIKGFQPTFNDDKALWASVRSKVYLPQNDATVFIGSSRIKFDLDIPTWETITNEEAVQLSIVGTSPRLLLQDLADDENFKGKVIVDITEVLFFSQNPAFHKSAKEAIGYYHKQTPSEKLGSAINFAFESSLVFLEERRFSLNTLLNDLELKNRPGIFSFPSFPKSFEWTTRDRQTYMPDMFLSNPAYIKRQTDIWSMLIMGDPTPPVSGRPLEDILEEVRHAVNKITARGGRVIFIRTPSSGPMAEGEQKVYPRAQYWDRLLSHTNSQGIHYLDNPASASMICPEWSHLSPSDAKQYTRVLIRELKELEWFDESKAILFQNH